MRHDHEWRANPEPQDRRVVLFNAERYDGNWPPEDAAGFLAWFQSIIEEAPDEYRDAVKIELDSVSGYEDSHYASIEVSYLRKETADEVAERLADYRARQQAEQAKELATLAALKAKYGE